MPTPLNSYGSVIGDVNVLLRPKLTPPNEVGALEINAPAVVPMMGLSVGEKSSGGVPQPAP